MVSWICLPSRNSIEQRGILHICDLHFKVFLKWENILWIVSKNNPLAHPSSGHCRLSPDLASDLCSQPPASISWCPILIMFVLLKLVGGSPVWMGYKCPSVGPSPTFRLSWLNFLSLPSSEVRLHLSPNMHRATSAPLPRQSQCFSFQTPAHLLRPTVNATFIQKPTLFSRQAHFLCVDVEAPFSVLFSAHLCACLNLLFDGSFSVCSSCVPRSLWHDVLPLAAAR